MTAWRDRYDREDDEGDSEAWKDGHAPRRERKRPMSRVTNGECPVCEGKGFIGEIAERSPRRVRRKVVTRPDAKSVPGTQQPLGRHDLEIAAMLGFDADTSDEGFAAALARALLNVYRGDREAVGGVLVRAAADRRDVLSRSLWRRTASSVWDGTIAL